MRIGLAYAVFAAELVYPTTAINNFLLAGIKRVAGRAHFDCQVFPKRRARGEFVATAAGDFDVAVIRMNVGFHFGDSREQDCKKGRVAYKHMGIAASP